MLWFYYMCAALTIVNFAISVSFQKKRANFFITGFFFIAMLSNMGYLGVALSRNLSEALAYNKVTYLGGCFLTLFMIVVVCQICAISLPALAMFAICLYSGCVFFLAMTPGFSDIYYKSAKLVPYNDISILTREYGDTHILFVILLVGFTLFNIAMLVYSINKEHSVSKKSIYPLLLIQIITVIVHFSGKRFVTGLDMTPLTYGVIGWMLLYVAYKNTVYNVEESIISSFEKQKTYGYILFDDRKNYIGCSDSAKDFLPSLERQPVDRKLSSWVNPLFGDFIKWIDGYDGGEQVHLVHIGERDFKCVVQYMYHFAKKCGYIIELSDDTKQQEYIRSLNHMADNRTAFLSSISREIRTPLSSVLGMNELIMRESEQKVIVDYAKTALDAGSLLVGLVNQIIDFTKIESGKLELSRSQFKLSEMLAYLKNMMNFMLAEKDLDYIVAVADNVPDVLWGDEARIKQILVNILNNAAKYTEHGRIDMSIESSLPKEEIAEGRMTELSFVIRDTGIGIKKEDLDDIFVPFEKRTNRRESMLGGAGLGLNIAKQFAELMDGDILVESTYGIGSKFTVKISLQLMGDSLVEDEKKPKKSSEDENVVLDVKAPNAVVMVVDDNRTNLAVAAGLLKKTQVKIVQAKSGKECLEKLEEEAVDLLFLDHLMPEMDGIDTLESIRSKNLAAGVPVIALTANAIDGAREFYIKAGFADYLAKPINSNKLERMLLEFLPEEKIESK